MSLRFLIGYPLFVVMALLGVKLRADVKTDSFSWGIYTRLGHKRGFGPARKLPGFDDRKGVNIGRNMDPFAIVESRGFGAVQIPSFWPSLVYPNNLKNREFNKEAAPIFCSGASDIVREQGASEDKKFAAKPTPLKTDFLGCWGISIFADALYWHATETIDWSYSLVQNGNEERATFKTVSFGWDPGFRVGLGYTRKNDQWDSQLYYTRFYTSTTGHASSNSGVITSAFLGNRTAGAPTYRTAKMKWSLHFNMLDWDLGHRFLVGKALSLRPFIGLKGGWIYQTIHTKWENPNFLNLNLLLKTQENLKNDFRGIGPKGGVNTKWIFGNMQRYVFSLFGDFAAAYMWGHWKINDEYQDNLRLKVFVKVRDRQFGAFQLQGLMGIGLDFNCFHNRSHCAMRLGYEIEDWFDQYQVLDNLSGAHSNDLILQGLTFDLRFDF